MQIDGLFSEKGRRNILSESWLYDHYAARTLKEPIMMIKSPAFEAPIHRRGGHYFVGFDCSTLRQGQAIDQTLRSAVETRSDGEVNVAGVSRTLTQVQMAHVCSAPVTAGYTRESCGVYGRLGLADTSGTGSWAEPCFLLVAPTGSSGSSALGSPASTNSNSLRGSTCCAPTTAP